MSIIISCMSRGVCSTLKYQYFVSCAGYLVPAVVCICSEVYRIPKNLTHLSVEYFRRAIPYGVASLASSQTCNVWTPTVSAGTKAAMWLVLLTD